ncbi:hypothetical protein L484_024388 [Morus notabilis]|uniref:Uncharacterized protein n=1 Tax=Morus notabilis TaxID=981085 RepID=W9SLI8_9ROSA|nr:uncharacterized protein LOC21407130 [Morus notabilis]EXC16217.1 hypothetical protein L484_024388 [Morus notabilis]
MQQRLSDIRQNRRRDTKNDSEKMGGRRRNQILVSLAVVMFLGVAVYFRLWSIDYSASSYDTELLRRQFDLANREAVDESAEWRLRYDEEAKRTSQCLTELKQLKNSSKKDHDATYINQKLEKLLMENKELHEKVEALKQDLEAERLKCKSQ